MNMLQNFRFHSIESALAHQAYERQGAPVEFRGNPAITAAEWGKQCMRARVIARSLGQSNAISYMTKRDATLIDAQRTIQGYTSETDAILRAADEWEPESDTSGYRVSRVGAVCDGRVTWEDIPF